MRTKQTLPLALLFAIVPLSLLAACDNGPGSTQGASGSPAAGGSGKAGSGTAGSGTAGSGTAGSGTAGSGTAGGASGGGSTSGGGAAGSSTNLGGTTAAGGSAAGSSAGGSAAGSSAGGSAAGSSAGGSAAGSSSGGSGGGIGSCKPGASQPAPDGCNTCVCDASGTWLCSAAPCVSDCKGPQPSCPAPPPDCDYVGGGCINNQWTCGSLACANSCKADNECPAVKIACKTCASGGFSCPESLCVGGTCDIVWSACQGVAPGLACEKAGLQQPADDGCNTCFCSDDLRWSCTKIGCATCEGPKPSCAPPPSGCDYQGGGCVNGQWTCGTLSCVDSCKQDADCPPTKMACKACPEGGFSCPQSACVEASCAITWSACQGVAPGLACEKPGLTEKADDGCNTCVCSDNLRWSCTEKVCNACEGPVPPCAPPPKGCDYQDGGCVNGQWTCGQLVCGAMCKSDNDCPQIGAPCQQCKDGSFTCPSSSCEQGVCKSSFPTCP